MLLEPAEFDRQLAALEKAIGKRAAQEVRTADELARVRAVVSTWFESLRPSLSQGLTKEHLDGVDAPLRSCMELTLQRSRRTRYRSLLRQARRAFQKSVLLPLATQTQATTLDAGAEAVRVILARLSANMAICYQQVIMDLGDDRRLSYRGPANELREILREVLVLLAPDTSVVAAAWYRPVEPGRGPTHQQRARYILEQRGQGSRVQEVADRTLSIVEEGLSKLVRDMYSRTSVAAHTSQDLPELRKILRHFDAIIHDLCG